MKKLIFSAIALFAFAVSAQAQERNALGLRLGDNDGFGGEISYQRTLASANRIEADLGFRNTEHTDAFKLAVLYQWVMNIEGGFNWYVGAGGGLGSFSHDYYVHDNHVDDSGSFLFVAGDIGIEYNFDIPLQLSLDFRPEIYFNDNYLDDSFGPDIALGIRYRF